MTFGLNLVGICRPCHNSTSNVLFNLATHPKSQTLKYRCAGGFDSASHGYEIDCRTVILLRQCSRSYRPWYRTARRCYYYCCYEILPSENTEHKDFR